MKNVYVLLVCLFAFTGLSAQTTWDNFEDIRKGTYGFINGTFIPYTGNPDATGVNTSDVVAEYSRNPAEAFDVLIVDAAMADLTDYVAGTKQISMDVWSPAAGTTIQITLENSTLAQPANFPTGRHSVYLATTSSAMAWETITFTFDNQPDAGVAMDNVDRLVLLFAPNTNTGDTYYWDNLNGPELANDPCDGVMEDPTILNDFECNQSVNFTFSHSGPNFRRVANPDMNGNESAYVASYTRNGGEENDVIIGNFQGSNLDITTNNELTIDVWDPNAPTTVTLSLQTSSNDVILAIDATTTTSSTWETLTFDASSVADDPNVGQFVILFDPGNFTSDNYFWDNFQAGPSTNVNEVAALSTLEVMPNPATDWITFNYTLEEAADIELSVRDLTGKVIDQLPFGRQQTGLQSIDWNIPSSVASGLYLYTLTVNGQSTTGKISIMR
jgi:hypothetical protein